MTAHDVTLGVPTRQGQTYWFDPPQAGRLLPPALIEGGGPGYLRRVQVELFGGVIGRVQFWFAATDSGDGSGTGPQLTPALESNLAGWAFRRGGQSRATLAGANVDSTEPYRYVGAAATGVYNAVDAAAGASWVVRFDDGQTGVTAAAGGPYTVNSGGSVQLEGGGSETNPSGPTTHAWTIESGQGGSFVNAAVEDPTFNAPVLELDGADRVFTVRYSRSNNSVTGTADAQITVRAPRSATTVMAEAGGPYTVNAGGTVELDGSVVVQNADGPTAYAWAIVSGGGSLQNAGTATPTYTPPALNPGDPDRAVVLRLTATNNDVSDTDDADLTARSPSLAAPVLTGTAGDGLVDVEWTVVPGAVGYERRHKRTASSGWGNWAPAENDRAQRFGGLQNGTSYDFQVRARGQGLDRGPASNVLTLTPDSGATPPRPAPAGEVDSARADAGVVVDLFTVTREDGTVERYTTGPVAGDSAQYGGETYRPLPIVIEGGSFSSSGVAVPPTLRASNLSTATAPRDWHGARIDRTRTLARYLDGAAEADSTRHWPVESWVVDRLMAERRDEVVWQLSSPLDLEIAEVPGRQVLRDDCRWHYRRRVGNAWVYPPVATGCPYRGAGMWTAQDEPTNDPALDKCSGRLSGCRLRFGEHGELPFGGFAGVARYRR